MQNGLAYALFVMQKKIYEVANKIPAANRIRSKKGEKSMSTFQASDEQWKNFTAIGRLHNQVCSGEISQQQFNAYVTTNAGAMNHPLILEVLLENIELTPSFLESNTDFCKTIYSIIRNTDHTNAELSFGIDLRLNLFLAEGEKRGWTGDN
jgi:hypothetical protein